MGDGDRPRIRVLPPEVAARIAAGEVIERPASVVKELLENALDAGARRIEVEVEGGGIDRLRVVDDGGGIPPEEVADAFERHATSKLRSERDLFAVRTLGFRGEALASIAAAADVDLVTRPPGQAAASVARMRGGHLAHQGSAAAASGTSVEVRDLFAALPARRRFLRGARAETRAVAEVVAAYALACPAVAFRLVADGRVLLATPGTGDAADALAAVHGPEVAAALLPVACEREEPDGEQPGGQGREGGEEGRAGGAHALVRVRGAAGPPSLHRASRRYIHLFANGRAIVSRPLVHAVERAYEGLIPAGRHPVAVVHVEVPPEQVDVNVHPTKAEVRFRHERLVYAAVAAAVREAVAAAPPSPLAVAREGLRPAPAPPAGRAVRLAGLDAPDDDALDGDAPGMAWDTGREVVTSARAASPFAPAGRAEDASVRSSESPTGPASEGQRADGERDEGGDGGRGMPGPLRALGQVDLTYLAAEASDGLYLVDQHAAHERVLYERLLAARAAGEPASQPLLAAAVVELAPAQAALAEELADELAAVGWAWEPADGRALLLRAVPAALAGRDPARALAEHLDRLQAEERLTGPDRVAASLACRASVMAGDRLDGRQQRELLRALEACEQPRTCPHGRPTMLHLSRDALARSFGRR